MPARNWHEAEEVAYEIRRRVAAGDNRRFLRSLPQFKVDTALPRDLVRLLIELDSVERDTQAG